MEATNLLKDNNIFLSKTLSTCPNTNTDYHEIGIVHLSETAGINFLRTDIKKIANVFGFSGTDSSVHTHLQKKVLKQLEGMVEKDQKMCNIRFEFESSQTGQHGGMVVMHAYGTLYEKV